MDPLTTDSRQCIADYRRGVKAAIDQLSVDEIEAVLSEILEAYDGGRQVFVIGNGGSAATASHMACDLAKTVLGKRVTRPLRRFRVVALTDNMPLVTAWGNDVAYETIFAEQLRNLANPGDLLIAITGSGNSANVVEAVRAACELELRTIAFLGFDGGQLRGMVDRSILVRSEDYGHIEDVHMILTHLITDYMKKLVQERSLAPA